MIPPKFTLVPTEFIGVLPGAQLQGPLQEHGDSEAAASPRSPPQRGCPLMTEEASQELPGHLAGSSAQSLLLLFLQPL